MVHWFKHEAFYIMTYIKLGIVASAEPMKCLFVLFSYFMDLIQMHDRIQNYMLHAYNWIYTRLTEYPILSVLLYITTYWSTWDVLASFSIRTPVMEGTVHK